MRIQNLKKDIWGMITQPAQHRPLVILGSTGSIGINALNVVRSLRNRFNIVGLSAYSNLKLLKEQINEFHPKMVCVGTEKNLLELKKEYSKKIKFFSGNKGLETIASSPEVDIVLIAIVGSAGLYPLISAINSRKKIALANKESIVMAGKLVMDLCKQHTQIIPVDSEHSAIFQCLKNEDKRTVSRLIITGSGGPFFRRKSMANITIRQALKHPRWIMGRKITIDSATMMNKGLEVIEAHHLFNMPLNRIKILVHPQSLMHSMVEFCDGAVLGLLSLPDMRMSIQYALTYPQRLPSGLKSLKLEKISRLEFYEPDFKKYSCLKLALTAAKESHTMPAVMNAANEIAVKFFLNGIIKFTDIPKIISKVMNSHKIIKNPELTDIISADEWARNSAKEEVKKC